jgi:hypothetical protein
MRIKKKPRLLKSKLSLAMNQIVFHKLKSNNHSLKTKLPVWALRNLTRRLSSQNKTKRITIRRRKRWVWSKNKSRLNKKSNKRSKRIKPQIKQSIQQTRQIQLLQIRLSIKNHWSHLTTRLNYSSSRQDLQRMWPLNLSFKRGLKSRNQALSQLCQCNNQLTSKRTLQCHW